MINIIEIIGTNRYFEIYSDGVLLCVLKCSLTNYDRETYAPSKRIILFPQNIMLGSYPVVIPELVLSNHNELEFIKDNIYNIEHPAFVAINRELKLNKLNL